MWRTNICPNWKLVPTQAYIVQVNKQINRQDNTDKQNQYMQ